MHCVPFESFEKLKHPDRPNSIELINNIFSDFVEFSGDRLFGDDVAIIGGIALLNDVPVTVIAQLRGKTLEQQIAYNFSMSYPEGFRKSLRLMRQAEKFHRPIICFVDTVGGYPGQDAEKRGQAVAIGDNLREMLGLKVPIITVLIGYGGSGGALALCIADRLAILEHAVLGVISPKACAKILWKEAYNEEEIVALLKMNSEYLFEKKIVDTILLEPNDGAHSDSKAMATRIQLYLEQEIKRLKKIRVSKLVRQRKQKFRNMGKKEAGF